MICIPGLTVVDLRAMSVSRLISIPGETSIESDASPASGRKPWATVPRNAAYCAWRLSRKTYARRSILPMRDLLSHHDLDAGRGPDPGRAGRDHVLHVLGGADPAGRLDAHLRPDRLPHQGDVEDGRPSLRVTGGGLDEVGLRLLRQAAGDDLLGVREEARLDDHLVRGPGLVAGIRDAGDVRANRVEHPALERSDVDDHVDLAGAVADGAPCLEGLDLARRGTEREADHRGDGNVRAAQVVGRPADPRRVDAHGREAMLLRLGAQLVDLGRRGVRPEQRVVDEPREVARDVVRLAVVPDARGAPGDNVADLRRAAGRAGAGAGEARIAGLRVDASGGEGGEHLACLLY